MVLAFLEIRFSTFTLFNTPPTDKPNRKEKSLRSPYEIEILQLLCDIWKIEILLNLATVD